jgi:hypothetical protein
MCVVRGDGDVHNNNNNNKDLAGTRDIVIEDILQVFEEVQI